MENIKRLTAFIKKSENKLQLSIGEVIIKKQIGQGGNGLVYSCSCEATEFAIKFLVTDDTGKSKEQKIKRFVAEYVNVLSLDRLVGIVRYIDYDILNLTDDNGDLQLPSILMKLYDGSLSKLEKDKYKRRFLSQDGIKSGYNYHKLLAILDMIVTNSTSIREEVLVNSLNEGRDS